MRLILNVSSRQTCGNRFICLTNWKEDNGCKAADYSGNSTVSQSVAAGQPFHQSVIEHHAIVERRHWQTFVASMRPIIVTIDGKPGDTIAGNVRCHGVDAV